MTDALFRADVTIRRGPLSNRAAIKKEVDDLAAKTAAISIRAGKGRYLTLPEMTEVNTAALRSLVSGDREPLGALVDRYVRDGFTA